MPQPKHHFFVCTNRRGEMAPKPSCAPNGSEEVLFALREEREKRGLSAEIYITGCGCLGPCPQQGATIVVYPDGVWYRGVTSDDVAEIVDSHMVGGRPVERLLDPFYL